MFAISFISKIFQLGTIASESSKVWAISGIEFLRGLPLLFFSNSSPLIIFSIAYEKELNVFTFYEIVFYNQ